MVVLLIILAIIIFILVVPFGVSLAYEDEELSVAARVLCFNIGLIPGKEKPDKPEKVKKEKKPKKSKKKAKDEAEDKEKPKKDIKYLLKPDVIIELLKLVMDALSRFRRKLTINNFKLHLIIASSDPCNAAVMYGVANTLLGFLQSKQGKSFKVLKSDVQTAVDFESEDIDADVALTITISLGRILAVAIIAGFGFLKIVRRAKKESKDRENSAEERKDKDGTVTVDSDGGTPAGQHG